MNKIVWAVIGILFLGIIVTALVFTTFFKSPDAPTSTNLTSPLYTLKYSKVIYPNQILTSGEIATNDLNIICYHYYDQLLVTLPSETTKQVYEEYMIDHPGYKEFEIDHWVPLALGGSNNLKNLWPQPVTSPGYKEKDYVQLYLRDQVCNHNMSLSDARAAITSDWYKLYLKVRGKGGD